MVAPLARCVTVNLQLYVACVLLFGAGFCQRVQHGFLDDITQTPIDLHSDAVPNASSAHAWTLASVRFLASRKYEQGDSDDVEDPCEQDQAPGPAQHVVCNKGKIRVSVSVEEGEKEVAGRSRAGGA